MTVCDREGTDDVPAEEGSIVFELKLETPVRASDAPVGRLSALVCDPTDGEVSHLVVRADNMTGADRLVSIEDLVEASDDELILRITRHEFFEREAFETSRFLPYRADEYDEGSVDEWFLPFIGLSAHGGTYRAHERIPRSEVALRRGTRVDDTDGRHLGSVHAFAFDPSTHDVTHLVMATGHIFHREDVTIPVTAIAEWDEETIRLSITADEVAELPHVPMSQ